MQLNSTPTDDIDLKRQGNKCGEYQYCALGL